MASFPTSDDKATIAGIKLTVGSSAATVATSDTSVNVNGNTSLIVSKLLVLVATLTNDSKTFGTKVESYRAISVILNLNASNAHFSLPDRDILSINSDLTLDTNSR